MKKQIPLLITFLGGIFMIIQFYIPHWTSQFVFDKVTEWMVAVGVFAVFLGLNSVFTHHLARIRRKTEGWPFSVVTLVGFGVTVAAALIAGTESGSPFSNIFEFVLNPIESTMFALLSFYIASAAYRSFRAKSWIAVILLGSTLLVMMGQIPLGAYISPWLPQTATWIMDVPNMASKRAILLGVGLGSMAVSLKIIVGIERSYLGTE